MKTSVTEFVIGFLIGSNNSQYTMLIKDIILNNDILQDKVVIL